MIDVIERTADQLFIPLTVGGGVRSVADMRELLRAGADKVSLNTAAIADPANQPVYFHCHHGINRASMAQMAYRMLYCGWDLKQASDEIDRNFGLVEASRGPDHRHMERFYRERVLPRRLVSNPASPAARTAAKQADSTVK